MTKARKTLLDLLTRLSEQYPDMRLGQLIVNLSNWATQQPDAIWDVPDEALVKAAKQHLESKSRKKKAG